MRFSLRRQVDSRRSAPVAHERRTYAQAGHRAAHHIENGQAVIFDPGDFTRREREQVRDIARRTGSEMQFIYVPASADAARRRWLHSRETRQRFDVRDEDFDPAVRMSEPPEDEPDVISPDAADREHTS